MIQGRSSVMPFLLLHAADPTVVCQNYSKRILHAAASHSTEWFADHGSHAGCCVWRIGRLIVIGKQLVVQQQYLERVLFE